MIVRVPGQTQIGEEIMPVARLIFLDDHHQVMGEALLRAEQRCPAERLLEQDIRVLDLCRLLVAKLQSLPAAHGVAKLGLQGRAALQRVEPEDQAGLEMIGDAGCQPLEVA